MCNSIIRNNMKLVTVLPVPADFERRLTCNPIKGSLKGKILWVNICFYCCLLRPASHLLLLYLLS